MIASVNDRSQTPLNANGGGKMELVINWFFFALYSGVVFFISSYHEPWRDEAQSWLLARDCSPFGLLKQLPYEGHPPVFYLLLMPFAKMGLPFAAAGIINNLVAIACAWLIIFKSKLPIYLRVAIIFSYLFLFQYAVIARSYALIALLLFSIVTLYEDRFKKPLLYATLVFLLFQTHLFAFPFASGFVLLFLIDLAPFKNLDPKKIIAISIMATGLLGFLLFVYGVTKVSYTHWISPDRLGSICASFYDAFFLNFKISFLGVFFYALLIAALFRKPMVLLFIAVGLTGYCYIIAFKWVGLIWQHGLLISFLASAYALATRYQPLRRFEKLNWIETSGAILFSVLLGTQTVIGTKLIKNDMDYLFSDSKNAAAFINKNGLYNYTIIGHRSYIASAVVPYLPDNKAIWYADCKRYGTFVHFDECNLKNSTNANLGGDYAPLMAKENFKTLDSVILLVNQPIQDTTLLKEWEAVYTTTGKMVDEHDETYIIYKHRHGYAAQ